MNYSRPPLGYEVYNWPEFIALCKRLGVQWPLKTKNIAIFVPENEPVRIIQDYHGDCNPGGFAQQALEMWKKSEEGEQPKEGKQ
jgi:hypothetical protein